MKISIVVSTFNGEKYIFDQLYSILYQTRKPDEVLIFDDCSTDDTVKIITDFIKNNNLQSFWKLYMNESNKGWRKNFMDGMWASNGDLVFTCDQDDIWLNTKLAKMENIMVEHPNIKVLMCDYIAFYENGKEAIGPLKPNNKVKALKLKHSYLNILFPGCTYCIRRDIIEESKIYWDCDFPHDATVYRLALFTNSLYSYGEPLIRWRKHLDSSFSKEVKESKNIRNKLNVFDYYKRQNAYLLKYVEVKNKPYKILINNCDKWLDLRINFYKTRKISYWIKLINYLSYYGKIRRWFLDLYIVLRNR